MKMKKDEIRFQIDQMRKDQLVWAMQAAAFNLGAFIFIAFGYSLVPIPTQVAITISTVALVAAVLFTLYMGVVNFLRLRKIKLLEKKLYK